MKAAVVFIILLQFFTLNIFSQTSLHKAQKVREFSWNNQASNWVEIKQSYYTYNNKGDTLEKRFHSQYNDYKIVRQFNNTHQPISEIQYYYFAELDTWLVETDRKYTYTNGLLTLLDINHYDQSFNLEQYKTSFIYDSRKRLVENYTLKNNDNSWEKISGYTLQYTDSANFLIGKVEKQYDTDEQDYVNYKKRIYHYNKGVLTKEEGFLWDIDYADFTYKWTVSLINEYIYDASGKYTEQILFDTETSNQVPYSRQWAIKWYDWSKGLKSSYIYQIWDKDLMNWRNLQRFTISYPDSERTITVIEVFKNNTWDTGGRETKVFYPGKINEFAGETYYNNAWNTYWHYQYKHTNDSAGNLYETILKQNDNENKLVENSRWLYEDYVTIVGIKNTQSIFSRINIYPNPAKDKLNIKVVPGKAVSANITLTDITGRTIYSSHKELNNAENILTLDIEELKAGIYILKLETENGGFYSQKILKAQ